jgi:putative selenium metabolism hydrolase
VRDSVVDLAAQMIRIPSVTGEEKNLSRFLEDYLRRAGVPKVFRDRYHSVIAVVPGRSRRTLVLDGHLDTVAARDVDAWRYGPFDGTVAEAEDGSRRLYGRGASDMKGSLAAMITSLLQLLDSSSYPGGTAGRDMAADPQLPFTLALTATASEETYEGYCLGKALEQLRSRGYDPAAVVIGEASSLNLMYGQRGRAEIRVTAHGSSAHSAHPDAGVNAVENMGRLLSRFEEIDTPEDADLGRGIATVTDIISEPYPGASVIPHRCSVTIDRRTVSGENESGVLSAYSELITRISETYPQLIAQAEIVTRPLSTADGGEEPVRQFHPAWKLEKSHPVVEAALSGLESAGIRAELDTYDFCSNGSRSAGIEGIPTIGFGPSREELAHVRDEYIEVAELERAVEGYSALIESLGEYVATSGGER